MDASSTGLVTRTGFWGLAHPWSGNVSFKTLACILAVLLIVIFFAHDGVRLAQEHVA